MLVRDWMTRNPVTIGPDTPVQEAYRIFREYEIRHLPVVDNRGRLIGLVSDHDIGSLLFQRLGDDGPRELGTVEAVMTRNVISIHADEQMSKTALLLHNRKFGCLPVVGVNEELLGIITTNDMLEILIALLTDQEKVDEEDDDQALG
ncbi:MAG: CBS domain-containing protein [Candidatus Eisenbacteria bacterium]|uniref:CBS domain-containing protein n=1 Tax=Eiseniibacteriota bacterium TaxID=2212470 RepID=A0A956SCV7_UNCEI|nr:CBS domain-containing protein [Candidatus Eisenbacteria bacterium]